MRTCLLTQEQDRRLLVLATTSERSVLQQLSLFDRFDAQIAVPTVSTQQELGQVLRQSGAFSDGDNQQAIRQIEDITGSREVGVGIKKILTGIETAKQDQDMPGRFAQVIAEAIATREFA